MTVVSLLAGVGFGLVAWLLSYSVLTDAQIFQISSALITVSVTALGFLITALSIFAALFTRELVQRLSNTGHFRRLILQMFVTAGLFLSSTLAGIVCLFTQGKAALMVNAINVGLAAAAIALLCVVGYRFYLVLTNVR